MKNIVFIEGVSGAGKSSCAVTLCEKLCDLGFFAEVYLEGDLKSPLDLFHAAYITAGEYEALLSRHPDRAGELAKNALPLGGHLLLRYRSGGQRLFPPALDLKLREREFCYLPKNPVPLAAFTEVFAALWSKYARSERTQAGWAIFDGSLISHMSSDLIRNYSASPESVAAHLEALIQTIRRLNPVIFYLSPSDAGQRLISARQSRGQSPPSENDLRFWRDRKSMDMAVLSRLSIRPHVIDIGEGIWKIQCNT